MSDPYDRDVMIDIETAGNGPRAAVVAIAAVLFDPMRGEELSYFYERVLPSNAQKHGDVDIDTMLFWAMQNDSVRDAAFGGQMKLPRVLHLFQVWWAENATNVDRVWANGPSFDLVILENAFQAVGKQHPWDFRSARCCRTICDLAYPCISRNDFVRGERHNALADARHQADYVSAMWHRLKSGLWPEGIRPEESSCVGG